MVNPVEHCGEEGGRGIPFLMQVMAVGVASNKKQAGLGT